MHVFAAENDLVICQKLPSENFCQDLQELGFATPQFILQEELPTVLAENSASEFEFCPWGNSPAEQRLFSPFMAKESLWQDSYKQLFERKTAAKLLEALIRKFDYPESLIPKVIYTVDELEQLVANKAPIVVKSPLSSSGRGIMVLRRNYLNDTNKQWTQSQLQQQGYLTAENWLDKKYDFSLQFKFGETIEFSGISLFKTNSNGQYSGHTLHCQNQEFPPSLHEAIKNLGLQLQKELHHSPYSKHRGNLGIDGLIYWCEEEEMLKIHPCLEVNPRFTMGALALELEKMIHPHATGLFNMHFDKQGQYAAFVEQKKKNSPLAFSEGKIRKGFFTLTPADSGTKFGAYVELF